MAASAIAAVAATTSAGSGSKSSSSSNLGTTPAMARRYSSVIKRAESGDDTSTKRSKVIKLPSLPSQSSTTVTPSSGNETTIPNQELMSHLTEEEKSILSKVFLKEEQFRRESTAAALTAKPG